jgi:hypothetical protein
MNRRSLLAALALSALSVPALAQNQLITPILWYNVDAYCAFQPKGEPLVYDAPATWRFVFLADAGLDGNLDPGIGYIAINSRLLQLERLSTNEGKDGEVRTYRSYGPDPYTVTVRMRVAGTGEEHTDYTGLVEVEGPGGTDAVEFEGSCGV